MKTIINTIFCLIFLIVTSPVLATEYYVSNSGNDAASGTISSPLLTIPKAIGKLVPGDIVYVRAGTYPGFSINKSGTAAAPVTVSGYKNEMPLITGGNGIKTYQVSYVNISGFEITGATTAGGIRADQSSNIVISRNKVHDNFGSGVNGIKILESSNNKVLNNEVYNNTFSGIHIYGTTAINNEIANNTVHDNTLSTGNSDGIGCNSGFGQNIHHNIVYGNSDDGIDTWNCYNNTVAYNIVHHNGGTGDGNGIKAGGAVTGGHNLVTHNISYSNVTSGITGNGSGGNNFKNNVTYGNGKDGINDGWRTETTYDPTNFINNISFANVRTDVSMSSGMVGTSHNNLWGKAMWNFNPATSLSQFYLNSGFDNPNNGSLSSITGDPLFINTSIADFHLQPGSKACTSGENGSYLGVYPCTINVTPTTVPTTIVSCQQAAIPAYFYPSYPIAAGSNWDLVTSTLKPGEVLLVNPSDGSGTTKNSAYAQMIATTANKGLVNMGYVYTEYGTRSLSTVKTEIDNYFNWYGVKSIFLDEASTDVVKLTYYQDLYNYIKSRGGQVMINPGTIPAESYVTVADQIIVFEDVYPNYAKVIFPSWIFKYPSTKFVHLVHSTPSENLAAAIAKSKQNNAGYIYVTDDVMSNPWDKMPSYWSTEVSLKCPGTVVPTSIPTSVPTATPTVRPTSTPTSIPTPTMTPTPIITVDKTLPIVKITSPVSGSTVHRHHTTVISATATDNIGVTKLEYYVNNSLKCTYSSVKSCSWPVPKQSNVTYNILVKAYDAAGNVGSSTITVRSSR